MSTNYLAPAITILGLLICFLSTYFRKICSAVIGFVWGTIISAIVLLVMSILGMLALAETDLLIFAIIIGVICAVIFYLFEKIAAIINSFLLFAFLALILGLLFVGDIFSSISVLLIFMVIAGAIGVAIQILFDKYAFAVITAFTGALIAGIGFISMTKSTDLSTAAYNVFYGDTEFFSSLPVYVIILGSMGTAFQLYGLSLIRKKLPEATINSTEISALIMPIIKNNILVVIVPIFAAVIPAIFNLLLLGNAGAEALPWIKLFFESVLLGSIVFLVSYNQIKGGLLLAAFYNALYILVNFNSYFVGEYRWPIDWSTFKCIETAVILVAVSMIVKNISARLASFPALAYVSYQYLMSYISVRDVFAIDYNAYNIVGLLAVYIVVAFLCYKHDGTIIYRDKTSFIVLAIVVALLVGVFASQVIKSNADEKAQKGGWQNYKEEQGQYKNEGWTIIKNESKYPDLIAGELTAEQLQATLSLFTDPTDSEDIDLYFEDSYWPTFMICDRPEQITDEENPGYAHYMYAIDDVNNKISGVTNFQYQADDWYDDDRYTDEDNLHIIVPATGWDSDMYVKNIRGRYNQEEMVVDYDWYSFSYDSGESEEWYEYSLSAIFEKNSSGKFQLDKITLGEQKTGNDNTEENYEQLMSEEQQAVFDETLFQCLRGQENESQSLIKFHLDGSFDEFFFRSDELIESAGTWTYDVDSETLTIIDNARTGEEELFIKDGDAFRSEEVMGDDYHWLSPDRMGRDDLFY